MAQIANAARDELMKHKVVNSCDKEFQIAEILKTHSSGTFSRCKHGPRICGQGNDTSVYILKKSICHLLCQPPLSQRSPFPEMREFGEKCGRSPTDGGRRSTEVYPRPQPIKTRLTGPKHADWAYRMTVCAPTLPSRAFAFFQTSSRTQLVRRTEEPVHVFVH